MGSPGKHRAKRPSRGTPFGRNSIHKVLVISTTAAIMAVVWMALSAGSGRARSAAGTTAGSVADAERSRAGPTGSCAASYYDGPRRHTANGESFDQSGLTAAHRKLPLGSKVRVTNKITGDSVIVRVNDRGPFVPGRCLDLSKAAMAASFLRTLHDLSPAIFFLARG